MATVNPSSCESAGRVGFFNRRTRTLLLVAICTAILIAVSVAGMVMDDSAIAMNLRAVRQPPSLRHPFGTDWIGRDMLCRTIMGLSRSIRIGVIAALTSSIVGAALGLAAALFGPRADRLVQWLNDVAMSIPHLVFVMLVAILFGKGATGIMMGIILTHWVRLTRLIRAEVLQLRNAQYVKAARDFGKSRLYIAVKHIIPHVFPQFCVGVILLFPHAILHEASITFLGFGLPPHVPAIGVILSESMGYLSTGLWWLAMLPGVALIVVVRFFDVIGDNLQMLLDPRQAHN